MSENAIRVLIADDNPGMRLILSKRIAATEGFCVCGMAEDGQQVLDTAPILKPKVIFLDVDMPCVNGLECAKELMDEDPSRIIIFATGHEEYRENAFEVYAFDYLVKPFDLERLDRTLERIRMIVNRKAAAIPVSPAPASKSASRLMLHHKDGVVFLDPDEILLVQREDRCTVYYTRDGNRYITQETLSEAEERLDPEIFFRCHKSYIINISSVRNVTPYGRWTYAVTLDGIRQDALITKEKYDELQQMFT